MLDVGYADSASGIRLTIPNSILKYFLGIKKSLNRVILPQSTQ